MLSYTQVKYKLLKIVFMYSTTPSSHTSLICSPCRRTKTFCHVYSIYTHKTGHSSSLTQITHTHRAHEAIKVLFDPFFFICPVFPKLVRTLNGGLHMMVILFLLVAVGFALVSLSFCIYNAHKVPYQSIKGHKGLYLWNCIAGTLGKFVSTLYLKISPQTSLGSFTFHLFPSFDPVALRLSSFPHCSRLLSSSFRGPGLAVFPGSCAAPQSVRAGGQLWGEPLCACCPG